MIFTSTFTALLCWLWGQDIPVQPHKNLWRDRDHRHHWICSVLIITNIELQQWCFYHITPLIFYFLFLYWQKGTKTKTWSVVKTKETTTAWQRTVWAPTPQMDLQPNGMTLPTMPPFLLNHFWQNISFASFSKHCEIVNLVAKSKLQWTANKKQND